MASQYEYAIYVILRFIAKFGKLPKMKENLHINLTWLHMNIVILLVFHLSFEKSEIHCEINIHCMDSAHY